MINRVALAGYAGAGKDEAAKALIRLGYSRHCFGDIIKRQLDPLIREHFGFSAFTDDRESKAKVRRTMEFWGEDNYDRIFDEFFRTLPEKAVNTRLVRLKEAVAWVNAGGVIVEIFRPGVVPATNWERDRFEELVQSGLITATVDNDGSTESLQAELLKQLDALR